MRAKLHLRTFALSIIAVVCIVIFVSHQYLSRKREPRISPTVESATKEMRIKSPQTKNVKTLIESDKDEFKVYSEWLNLDTRHAISNSEYKEMTLNCSHFISSRTYITHSLTDVEKYFPIAYSILTYTNVEQTERLLRAIYRPQNIYCIHVDKKTDDESFNAVSGIAKCFNNVFLTDSRIDVRWGEMSVLEPELMCLRQFWKSSVKWKYFINLTGQEFPLKTNYELVQILHAYGGANDVECSVQRANKERWTKAGPPPHNIVPVKGAVHVVLSQEFVGFLLHDKRSLDFLEWSRNTYIPDETYFSSMNHNPFLGAPGSYNGTPETDFTNKKPFLARYKTWNEGVNERPCFGKWVHNICVFGSGDMPQLAVRKELFANKFNLGFQDAFERLEELIFNRTRNYMLGTMTFNASWYASLGFVRNRI